MTAPTSKSDGSATILLHQTQIDYLACELPFAAFTGGIGSGKSFVLCYDSIRRARRNRLYMMVAPTYPLLRDATLRSWFGLADQLKVPYRYYKSEHRVELLNTRAEILFRSADAPETLRATNLSGVYLDEASIVKRDVFDILIGRLRQGGKFGFLRSAFTPKGMFHWTYEVFIKNKDGLPPPNTAIFHCRSYDNPFLPAEFITALEGQYTPTFARQELGGEFLNVEGAEWGGEYFPDSIWFDEWPDAGLSHLVISLDPSMGATDGAKPNKPEKRDYSALVATARDKDGVIWVEADLERRDTEKMIRDGLNFARRMRHTTHCELEGFGVEGDLFQSLLQKPFIDASRAAGFPLPMYKVMTGGVNKAVRIRRLTPPLVQGQFRFRRTPGTMLLVQQMREFPVGEHDDGPDGLEQCLRLGNDLLEKKMRGRRG